MSQLLLFFSCFLVIREVAMFMQNDYILDFYRAEVTTYDKDYFRDVKVFTYKYNRTTPAVNATMEIMKDMGNDLEVVAQAYTFLSNEYRIFPLRFQFNFCKGMEENHFGMAEFYTHGHFARCPIKMGKYYFGNWKPDQSKFPPFLPSGKYKLEMEFMYINKNTMLVTGYAEIKRNVAGPRAG